MCAPSDDVCGRSEMMTNGTNRVNLLIAHATRAPWSAHLVESLSVHPVDLHWSHTDTETIDIAVSGRMHAAVVDHDLPVAGGLDLLRSIRQLGIDLPCLLVCGRADQRLLQEALALDVFSVVQAEASADLLAPMVLKAIRQTHRIGWAGPNGMN